MQALELNNYKTMQPEFESLVQAIEGLHQEANIFKDYVYPTASALFASLLGAGVAFFTLKYNENIQIEKNKMDSINKWTFIIEEARANLLAIKGNYHGNLTANPSQRMSAVPTILFYALPILEKCEQLSFIIPKAETSQKDIPKWGQILRIRSMINNYNYLLDLWEKRNEVERPIKEKIMKMHSNETCGYANLGHKEVLKCIGPVELSVIIDITEKLINLTDDLLIEFNDFLLEFPKYAETHVNTKILKKYGSIFKHSNSGNQLVLNLLKKSPEADYSMVEEIFGETSTQIKMRFRTGYED